MQTKYQKYGLPQSIIINKDKYSFKSCNQDTFISTYRCYHRTCKCYIKISKEQLDLINSEESNKKITFDIFYNHEHNKREVEVTQENIRTEKENEILAISLIK